MKNKKNLFKLLGASVMLVALGSCGAASGAPNDINRPTGGEQGYVSTPNVPGVDESHKVIYQVDYTIYEDNFHKAASEISMKAVELEGYVLTSTEDFNQAQYNFKIPTKNLNLFVSFVDTYHVGNKNINTKDITEQYESIEDKLEELKQEKAMLEEMLTDESLETQQIAAYTARLKEVNSLISKYTSQKAEQDKIVNYSTVEIRFYESKKTESDIYWDNYFHYMKVVGKGFGTIVLYSAPFAVVAGLAIGVAYLLVKKKEK